MWSRIILCSILIISANAFSKYGRTCKDIGCLNSEVCVIAEDPCSFGRQTECGSYPTCKKKTAADVGGDAQNVPAQPKPTIPKPVAKPPPRYDDDDIPNYPPPPPPRGSYGSNTGGSTYGGGSNYGGGGTHGGGATHGGGSNSGGLFGGGSLFGGSDSSSGGLFGPGGILNSILGSNGGKRPNSGSSDFNPFSALGIGSGSTGSNGGNTITSFLSNVLGNLTKAGIPNTRPLIENRNNNPSNPYGNPSNPYGNPSNPYGNPSNPYGNSNPYGYNPNPYNNQPGYPGNNPYQRPSGYYPSYQSPNNAGQQTQKNYNGNQSGRNQATTTLKPVSYGWNVG